MHNRVGIRHRIGRASIASGRPRDFEDAIGCGSTALLDFNGTLGLYAKRNSACISPDCVFGKYLDNAAFATIRIGIFVRKRLWRSESGLLPILSGQLSHVSDIPSFQTNIGESSQTVGGNRGIQMLMYRIADSRLHIIGAICAMRSHHGCSNLVINAVNNT